MALTNNGLFASLLALGAAALPAACGGVADEGAINAIDPAAQESVEDTAMTFEEFLATVYQEPDTGLYIVDGDVPIRTKEELEKFYAAAVLGDDALIVHQAGGVDVKWQDFEKMNITYCVSTAFGADHGAVVNAMIDASQAWEQAANVNFVHVNAEDGACDAVNTNVVFDVRPVSGQPFLARAFFPDYAREIRNVLIDGSSFTTEPPLTLTGILRHELGHALGFRHEHTRPESGGSCFEDDSWRPLTGYDSASVMHYPQCNGTGDWELQLTQDDKDGAAALYGEVDCSHDRCDVGASLSPACDPCVADVCAADPYCCNVAWDAICVGEVASICGEACSTTCEHPKCEEGTLLEATCDPCVGQVCAADPYCCNTGWDSICVGEVTSICGETCP